METTIPATNLHMGYIMPTPHDSFANENDEDLIFWMSCQTDDRNAADAACREFMNRHMAYLYSVVTTAHADTLGESEVEDIVLETFERVFEKAGTYEPCGAPDVRGKTLNVLKWMGVIAHNIAMDHYRDRENRPPLLDDWNAVEERSVEDTGRKLSPDEMMVQAALSECSERDRTITLVTMQYYDPARPHQRLPNEVMDDLVETFETTPENIRQVRKRVLGKIRRRFDASDQDSKGRES